VQAASLRDGEGLPGFVEREFREFLTCGCLAAGFARFHCDACGHDRLVPFSCKGRGFCPSCGGRRMAERATHPVDHVLSDVPLRQWVLSLPRPSTAVRLRTCRGSDDGSLGNVSLVEYSVERAFPNPDGTLGLTLQFQKKYFWLSLGDSFSASNVLGGRGPHTGVPVFYV
jgi:transposase-like zinc-binding protein